MQGPWPQLSQELTPDSAVPALRKGVLGLLAVPQCLPCKAHVGEEVGDNVWELTVQHKPG